MLRDLGQMRGDGTPSTRAGESDPSDSIFLVEFCEEIDGRKSWLTGSAWLTVGEAQGAANRYVAEGHKAHHGWTALRVMEYQTGQLAPKSERHGDEYYPPRPAVIDEAEEEASLELRLTQLRAKRGQSQSVGGA